MVNHHIHCGTALHKCANLLSDVQIWMHGAEYILYVPAPFNSQLITPKQDGVHLLLNDNGLVLCVIYVDNLMGCVLDQWNIVVHNLQNVQHVSIVVFTLEQHTQRNLWLNTSCVLRYTVAGPEGIHAKLASRIVLCNKT